MNGKERLYWAEDATGYVYLTLPESPLRPGFQKFSTTTPSEMDRIYAKLDRQEKKRHAEMTELMFNRRREFIDTNLSSLRTKMANSNNAEEREVIRAWIQAFNNKMDKLMKNTVYGVAAMQAAPAPIPVERPMLTVEDIRLGPLELMKPATEAIQ
jgi:hypothetical protein